MDYLLLSVSGDFMEDFPEISPKKMKHEKAVTLIPVYRVMHYGPAMFRAQSTDLPIERDTTVT